MLQEIYTVVSHVLDLVTNPQQDINDTAESNQILNTGFLQIGGTMGFQRITIGEKWLFHPVLAYLIVCFLFTKFR